MAYLNNKITEEQIRNLVSENKNIINPLNMAFSYEYVTRLVPINWSDLLYGVENKFLSHQSAIKHALVEIEKSEDQPAEVLDLACMLLSEAKFPQEICQLVNKLATSCNSDEAADASEKFLYVSLHYVYEHRNDYSNLIEVVDIICDDINNPAEVKKLISFMQTSTLESNSIECLYSRLDLYLKNQRKRFGKHGDGRLGQ